MKTAQKSKASQIQCASAKNTGIVLFYKKSSRFENYRSQNTKKRGSEKSVQYSTDKLHFDALVRKAYREARRTDKTTSRESLLQLIEESVKLTLKARRLYYDFEQMQKPIAKPRKLDTFHMNMIQRAMYRRVMYGLAEFTPEQIADLTSRFERKVVDDHKKAKLVIQSIKAKRLYRAETNLINAIFQHAPIGEDIYSWTISIPKKYTLKSMGISTLEVVDAFMTNRLLPRNFMQLDVSGVEL